MPALVAPNSDSARPIARGPNRNLALRTVKPGETMQVFELEGRIEVVPVRSIRSFRGRYKGISTSVERDEDRV
jgi:hypothetical protein